MAALDLKRSKLSEADGALAKAEAALAALENQEVSAIAAWSSSDCSGTRPVPDVAKHAALSNSVFLARRAVESAAPAIAVIDAAKADLRDKLDDNRQDIETVACSKTAADFEALGACARKLRAELAEIERQLAGGRAYFEGLAEHHYATFHKRNAAFDIPVKSAEAGLPRLEPGESQPLASREEIAKHRDMFAALQGD